MKKNTFIFILFLLTSIQFLGQEKERREKIKALKIAYLTEELQLTSAEAQKFWPIYNKHEENLEILRNTGRSEIKKKIKEAGSLSNLEEAEAKKFVLLRIELDNKTAIEKEEFTSKLSSFLSYKKIMKLHIAEREFFRKLMQKYNKDRKGKE